MTVTISCPLRINARRIPDQPALITRAGELSYRDLAKIVQAEADHLAADILRKNKYAAICAFPGIDYIVYLLALWQAGVTILPLNPKLPPDFIRKKLSDLGCTVVFCGAREATIIEGAGIASLPLKLNKEPAANRQVQATDISIESSQAGTIVLTSGSTGEPKLAKVSYGNYYHNAIGANTNLPLQSKDRWLLSLPLYHVGGLAIIFRCLLSGAAIVLSEQDKSLDDCIEQLKITHVSMVPTQLYRILQKSKSTKLLATLKAVLLGGGPIPPSLLKKADRQHIPVYLTYGLTEMASQVATGTLDSPHQVKILPGREVSIQPDGEILVKGKTLFCGYINGNSIDLPLTPQGWFATGDLGKFTDNQSLEILGRKDNMFISGGENIQPEEIEKILYRLAGIEIAIVIPVKDDEFVARPAAVVKYTGTEVLSRKMVVDHLKEFLPRFKIPDVFYYWPEELEKTLNGKPNRQKVAKFFEDCGDKLIEVL